MDLRKSLHPVRTETRRLPGGSGPEHVTPFDQEQRYRLIGDLLAAMRGEGPPLHVLEVGGRDGTLRRYVAEDDRVALVDLEPSVLGRSVLGTGSRLPFQSRAFDAVVSADTLEHVPVAEREFFVRECCRVSKGVAVLAGPYHHPRVAEAERRLAELARTRLNVPHRFLEEHLELGLPDRASVETWCREAGATQVRTVGHGNLERWLGLMAIGLVLDDDPATRDLAARLHRFYNTALLPGDRAGEVYRHVVVAVLSGELPAEVERALAPPDVSEESGRAVLHALDELAAFDQQRDLFESERARLEEEIARRDRDLVGHHSVLDEARSLLAETRKALEVSETDLAGHRESLLVSESDLEQHRAELGRAERELVENQEAIETLRRDLDGHRAKLAETTQDLEGHRVVLHNTGVELTNVQAELTNVTGELRATQAHARALEQELLHRTRWQRRLRRLKRRLLRRPPAEPELGPESP